MPKMRKHQLIDIKRQQTFSMRYSISNFYDWMSISRCSRNTSNFYTDFLLFYRNGKEMFTNLVRTDGYAVDFILAGPKKPEVDHVDLSLEDFTPEEISDRFHLWGVDPGQTNIFTASDGNLIPHQARKYSACEYYTRAGYKKTNINILKFKKADDTFLAAESQISTFKTANLVVFQAYILRSE